MKIIKKYWVIGVAIFAVIIFVKACEQEPKVITDTKIVYRTKTDTIKETVIKEVPKKVYVERIKTIKGSDSIVYVKVPGEKSIEANQYDAELKANNATAKLKITTTGQLLDVTGTIDWKEKETTTTTTIVKPKSGLFIYGQTSASPLLEISSIGLDYQLRNTVIVGTSFSLDHVSKQNYVNVKVGFRLF